MRGSTYNALWLLALMLLVWTWPTAGTAEVIDRVVAVVDDEVITFQDVRVEGRIRMASMGKDIDVLDRSADREEELHDLVQMMVQTRLLVKEASRMQVPVGEEDVNQRLQMIYDRFGQTEQEYRQLMEADGISWEAFRRFLRDELRAQFVIRTELGGQVNVSEADVAACAREKMPGGERVDQLRLRQILIQAEAEKGDLGKASSLGSLYPSWWNAVDQTRFAAGRILHGLAKDAPAEFEALATRFSHGRSAERGGFLGVFARGDLSAEFDGVFDLAVGEVSDIIETSAGFHIIYVEGREAAASDRWVRVMQQCRGELTQEASLALIDQWLESLAERSFVSVMLFDDLSQHR